jgi:hypothetical protein
VNPSAVLALEPSGYETEDISPGRRRPSFGPKAIWVVLAVLAAMVILFGAWTYLTWSIAEHVYLTKAGLNWFSITFYHGYTFVVGGLLALLVINPRVGKSDLSGVIRLMIARRSSPYGDEFERPRAELRAGPWVWGLWQVLKWSIVFGFFVLNRAFPTFNPIMNGVMMLTQGIGNWAQVPRVLMLPFFPASGTQLVSLMPTMEVEYNVLSYVISAALLVFAVRMLLRLIANLPTRGTYVWLRNIISIAAAILFTVILTGPYWLMNIATPYIFGIVWTLFLLALLGYARFSRRNTTAPRFTPLKIATAVLIVLLVVQVAAGVYLYLNWNNNYLPYEWYPQTQKQITVTRWSAGLDSIQTNNITSLPTSNPTTTLNLVRQWDQTAAAVINTKEIGAYNWMGLASSEIVYYNNTEYWVSPTTPTFPSTDWISEHIIYTHAAEILVINTHNGSVVPVTSAFGVPTAPLIYYGEGAGFNQSVYVHVPGYDEVQNVTYPYAPDYTLSGWQKSMWMLFAEGQVGFAFSSYAMQMLWNRNIFNRVGDILIPGLTMDPSAYIVSDGKNLYYAVQVYINYPLQSGFSASPYLRYFGVVLVNIQDGSMQGYNVSNLIGTNSSDFLTQYYSNYYSSWGAPPSWLIPQLRYPEQLLGTPTVPGQLDYDFTYHVSDPFIFRSGTQFYERPNLNTTVQYIPFAVQNKTYFVGIQLVQYRGTVSMNLGGLYIAYGGDRLGQIALYQNPSTSATIIGPSAAENALNTNSQVRTQLTLLPNYRFGSYLLYSVGGTLTYFVAVYTNPGTSGVVTQLPFMTAINPNTGAVGVGTNAAAAFESLGKATNQTVTVTQDKGTTLKQIDSLISSAGYTLVNATSVNPTVYINEGGVSFSSVGANQTVSLVQNLLSQHGAGSAGNQVFTWTDSSGNVDFGVIQVPSQGVSEMFYVTIAP